LAARPVEVNFRRGARRFQSFKLASQMLILRTHPSIADNGHIRFSLSQATLAKDKPLISHVQDFLATLVSFANSGLVRMRSMGPPRLRPRPGGGPAHLRAATTSAC
jgi:hypothetical protein